VWLASVDALRKTTIMPCDACDLQIAVCKRAVSTIASFREGLSGIEATHCDGTTTAHTESTTIIRTPPGTRELKRSRLECHIGFYSAHNARKILFTRKLIWRNRITPFGRYLQSLNFPKAVAGWSALTVSEPRFFNNLNLFLSAPERIPSSPDFIA
jgi:hypothetical protein